MPRLPPGRRVKGPEPDALIPRPRRMLGPGAVHVPDWLDVGRQAGLVTACRAWATAGPGIRAATLPSGHTMSVRMVCLGWHWNPSAGTGAQRYSRTRDDQDGSPVLPFPEWLGDLGRAAVAEVDPDAARAYRPDAALVNFYSGDAKLGQHRDADERCDAPVVSLSLGAACVFRFGNVENRGRPWTDVELCSGDLVVFGGPSRFVHHGVPRLLPDLPVPPIGLPDGRLNITLRTSGLV